MVQCYWKWDHADSLDIRGEFFNFSFSLQAHCCTWRSFDGISLYQRWVVHACFDGPKFSAYDKRTSSTRLPGYYGMDEEDSEMTFSISVVEYRLLHWGRKWRPITSAPRFGWVKASFDGEGGLHGSSEGFDGESSFSAAGKWMVARLCLILCIFSLDLPCTIRPNR